MNLLVSESKRELSADSPIVEKDTLKQLNARSTAKGMLQLSTHLSILALSGYTWATYMGKNWAIAIPALVIYGFSLASMFAPLHECSHRTVFEQNWLNDAVGWLAGLLSGYNLAFFRRYHKWHHRYTQDPEKDPELSDRIPQSLPEYLLTLSGLLWWWGKLKTHAKVALGKLEDYPFISEQARDEVIRSTRLQLGVYAIAILVSIIFRQPWFVTYWLLPLFVGQPILRFILLAEHTGCTRDSNPFTNTRTTLTLFPMRFLMWNMPFHAEHHLYASIPFYNLPLAHQELKQHWTQIGEGYLKVNRDFATNLQPTSQT